LSDSRPPEFENPDDHCQLHCFPDLTLDDISAGNRCMTATFGFKRTDFKTDDKIETCAEVAAEIEADIDAPDEKNDEDLELKFVELKRQAYQKGFCDGQKKGVATAAADLAPAFQSLQQAAAQLRDAHQLALHDIEKETIELALAIARKIIGQEVKTDKSVIISVARQALQGVEVSGDLVIKLNPADYQYIQKIKPSIAAHLADVGQAKFEAHESIPSGGCVIETQLGDIDARIEQQLQIVEESLRAEFEKCAIGG
jgi:flagellar assembly protein FliH